MENILKNLIFHGAIEECYEIIKGHKKSTNTNKYILANILADLLKNLCILDNMTSKDCTYLLSFSVRVYILGQ